MNDRDQALCSSHTMDVFIVNDIVDEQPIVDPILVASSNAPFDVLLSTDIVNYSQYSNSLFFTLQDNEIRQVCFFCFLLRSY